MGIDKAAVTSMFSLQYANKGGMPGFWETIKGIIPINPFESLVQGNILAILFFSLFFGFGIASLKDNRKDTVISFFRDRKSTRLNSSHANISYAVFCLKKKKNN